jgi:ABC-type enterochelin transport system substrate-binding protein
MNNEQIGLALTILGMAAGLIWLIIRLTTKPLEKVVENNTAAMGRIYDILDRHEEKLSEHGESIAALDERTAKKRRTA